MFATTARLTFRLNRFEAVAASVIGLLSIVLAYVVAARLDALRLDPACAAYNTGIVTTEPSIACQNALSQFYAIVNDEAGKVQLFLVLVPFLAGLMLGVGVVGRELERGTTRLAWSLSPSRQRWFLQRLVPVLLFLAAVTLAMGFAADRLFAASAPGIDPANSFGNFGFRGTVLAARAVFIFALAVHIGAVMGRPLPALIIGAIIAYVGIVGGMRVHQEILQREAVVVEEGQGSAGDLYVDQRFRLPDGTLIDWQTMEQLHPYPEDGIIEGDWPPYPMVSLVVPGSRYGEVQVREMAALAGGSLVALLGTAFIVQRRRPG